MDCLGGTEAHLLASIMIPNFCFTLFLTGQVRPHIKHNQAAGLRIPKFTLSFLLVLVVRQGDLGALTDQELSV